jgi:hypothetical protein
MENISGMLYTALGSIFMFGIMYYVIRKEFNEK